MKSSFASLWLPAIVWAGVIFLFSSLPATPTSDVYWQDFVVKKTAHMIEYGIFSAILFRAFKESGNPVRQAGVYAILIAIAYAITDEFHQMFTPGREPTFRDIVFDTIGASLGVYMLSRNDRIRS